MAEKKVTIGWKESIDLPDWGIFNVVAKADTGARRSAVDVGVVKEVGENEIEFEIVLKRDEGGVYARTVRCEIAHVTHVRSSNGLAHERYFVQTRIRLGKVEKVIELSLVSRRDMQYRVLLGRKALEGDVIVDVEKSFLTRPRRKMRLLEEKRSSWH